jgi:predicted amidohydrolase
MRVAICQMHSGPDVRDNLDGAEALVRAAADEGADLAALPEYLEFMGPAAERRAVAQPVPGSTADRLSAVAAERGIWVLAGGILEADGTKVYDTSVMFDRVGEIVARYRKIHLFDVELPDQPPIRESATITAGDQLVTTRVEETRFGLSICYDVRFPELYRGLMTAGAEVLCVPSQFQFTTGKDHWHTLLRARAIENQCFVVAPGQWGPFGDPAEGRRSYGHSLVVDPWGRIVVEAPEEGTGVWVADLDLAALRSLRHRFPALQHRRLGASC